MVDSRQRLWMAKQEVGLLRLEKDREQIKTFRYIYSNKVTGISEDEQGKIWVSTADEGLYRYEGNDDSFILYDRKEGLPARWALSVISGPYGNLWLTTEYGLSLFDKKEKRFINYDLSNGLKSLQFKEGAVARNKKGHLLFPSQHGLLCVNPEFLKQFPAPAVSLTDFKIFNKSVKVKKKNENRGRLLENSISGIKEIRLNYTDSIFSFEFAVLDYNVPEKNQYAYRMKGLDDEWIQHGYQNEAVFTNLSPGEYTFEVKGANSDGIWSKNTASVKVIILPPWWATWWFRALSMFFVVFILTVAYNLRVRHLHKERNRQRDFSRQLIQSQEAERKRIASGLHDSLGQNLLIINNEIQLLATEHDELEGKFNPILSGVKESINEVREISYNLHPHLLDRLGLNKALESVINKISKATGIKIEYELAEVEKSLPTAAQIHFYRIIQEALNNMVKHSRATEAKISIRKHENYLIATVQDNGKGFNVREGKSKSNSKVGFGLANMQERAKLIGGRFKIISNKGKGIKIEVKLSFRVK